MPARADLSSRASVRRTSGNCYGEVADVRWLEIDEQVPEGRLMPWIVNGRERTKSHILAGIGDGELTYDRRSWG